MTSCSADVAWNDSDYLEIENAVMESARGRWFLSEYSRRHGLSGAGELMDAVRRIEAAIREQPIPALPYPPYDGIGNRPAPRTFAATTGHRALNDRAAQALAQFSNIHAQLKATLQDAAAATGEAPASQPTALDTRHLRYFTEDEDLFAPVSKVLSGLPVVGGGETLKDRKRIIVIRRSSSRDAAIPLADDHQDEERSAV